VASDYDNDGYPDIYVACDSTPSLLFHNQKDGTFEEVGVLMGVALNEDGQEQGGMGVAVGDYDEDGHVDILKTNFSDDVPNVYHNDGDGSFEDRVYQAGLGGDAQYVGWGIQLIDVDHDGLRDVLIVNGHVYPEVERLKTEAGYKQRKVVYRNLRQGRFADVTERLGPPVTTPAAGRGAAFADFDNDGDTDVIVNNVHAAPDLFRLESPRDTHWLTLKLVGTRSNRSAIGARVRLFGSEGVQVQEVRGGGSYYSQNDFRVNFGLGRSTSVERVEIRWPNGLEERWGDVGIDRIVTLKEGSGVAIKAGK
jgi:hypothetical protein